MPFRPSPFPGMDPYIQAKWSNAHAQLIASTVRALAPQLADDLTADIEERVLIDQASGGDDDDGPQTRRPDVRVVQTSPGWDASRPAAGETAVAEPILLADPGPDVERAIRIVDDAGDRIITAIEVLSPRNKLTAGGGREAYRQKRRELLDSDANLVEIDLIRAGDWTVMVSPFEVPRTARSPYGVTVARADPPGGPLGLYPIRLAERLPVIRVPLRPGERDVTLDLQQLIDDVYRLGRYDKADYAHDCDPPLAGPDADWADGLLRAAGRRS